MNNYKVTVSFQVGWQLIIRSFIISSENLKIGFDSVMEEVKAYKARFFPTALITRVKWEVIENEM